MKLQPYNKYYPVKLNFLSQLPVDWKIIRAKYLFREINERSKSGTEQLLSVSEHKGVVPRESINVTMFQAESYEGYKLCKRGDLVINSLWAWHRGIGVSEYEGIVSTAYSVLRLTKPEEWNSRFLNHLLRTSAYTGEYFIRSKGIWRSRLQLTGNSFLDVPILVPPLSSQNQIVNYIDNKLVQMNDFIENKKQLGFEIATSGIILDYQDSLITNLVTGKYNPYSVEQELVTQ